VLANQHEFLTQFMDHVYGNPDEDIPQCTNIPELEQKYNRKLAGFPRKDEDYENFQIFVMTYQQYLSEKSGKQRFSKISKNVGSMFIDEAHKGASNGFAEVLQRFPVKYRGGVTATLDRKDGRSFILKHIIGPKTAESSVDSLIPTVYAHETGFTTNRMFTGRAGWVRANQALARDKKRNAMIVDYVMKDLAKGHNIVIPVYFKKHAFELQQLINDAWTAAGHDKPICTTFVGGGGKKNKADRKQKLSEAKLNHFRVTVGIRSLLQLGLNVPAWSAIYTALPISNEPNYKQETSRVRTPKEGKRQPIVRVFFEEGLGVSIGCARNCMKQMAKFGYAFSSTPKQRRLFAILANSGRRSEPVDLGDADYKPHRAFLDEKPKGKQPRKPLLSSRRV
jgi:superfamily II DNA or RNA helicase